VSASPAVQMGFFGPDDPAPYVTLDGTDFPLVPGSIVEGAPLNPFSPSNSDGNTVAVVSQRHASEVWDDLTGGLGFRDDEPGTHQYASGNLDVRVPSAWTVPPLAGGAGTGGAAALPYTAADVPVRATYVSDDTGLYCFIAYSDKNSTGTGRYRRIIGSAVATVGIPDTDVCRAEVVQWSSSWWTLTRNNVGRNVLWQSTGAPNALAFTNVYSANTNQRYGLVSFDDKLISYNATTNAFEQWDAVGLTWIAYVGGYVPLPGNELPQQLFVWSDKSGSKDALYTLTNKRLLVYDDEGQQWEPLYYFSDLFQGGNSRAEVNRRDNSLVVAVMPAIGGTLLAQPAGTMLLFTPGTVDNIPINKGYGFPAVADFGFGNNTTAPVTAFVAMLESSIHWLYAFCYAPSPYCGGVYAFNEFGGWTQVFDPAVINATHPLVGGGYGGNLLLTVSDDGKYWLTRIPDMQLDHPQGTYDSQAAGSGHDYFVRSGRIFNKQKNVKKLGSHVEVTFKQPIPLGQFSAGTVYLKWRYFNESGLSAWQTSALFTSGTQRMSVNLHDGFGSNGIQYYYMEWELHMYMPTATAVPPVAESLVLYYTYFQTNKYAYSMNIDLTTETWAEFYPDGTFHGKTREYLQTRLLALPDYMSYHTFTYSQLYFTETVGRADLSLARRESSDDASGVYSLTVRDLEMDAPSGIFFTG
jgi:hypothetical protein